MKYLLYRLARHQEMRQIVAADTVHSLKTGLKHRVWKIVNKTYKATHATESHMRHHVALIL